jgi:hypothetical protein
MILAISSVAIIACQGCSPSQASTSEQVKPTRYQLVSSGDESHDPVIRARSSFSLSQGQTATTPQISIKPVIGEVVPRAVKIALSEPVSVTALRGSNAAAVVDFERGRNVAKLTTPARQIRKFDAELAISATDTQTGLGFDVAAVPRVSVREDGPFKQRSVGGEIRIGQNFDQRGKDIDASSWYLFAGADGEALVYEPDNERNLTNRMALRDQITVGDMQAGVSFTRGSGQLSLSYIHREVEYNERGLNGQRAAEDFAGVSFTLRR